MKKLLSSFPMKEFFSVLTLVLVVYSLLLLAISLAQFLINPAQFEAGHARRFGEYAAERFGSSVRFSYWVGSLIGFFYLWKVKAQYGMTFRSFLMPFFIISVTSLLSTLVMAFYADSMAVTLAKVEESYTSMNQHTFLLSTEMFGNALHFFLMAWAFLLAKQIELHAAANDFEFRWIYEPNSMYDVTPYLSSRPSDDEKEP
jgi:hypothetical protein